MNPDAHAKFESGSQLLDRGEIVKAIQVLKTAVQLVPDNAAYRSKLARAYSLQENYDEAIKEAQIAINLSHDFSGGYSQLSYAQLQLGRYSDAVANSSKAIELEPDNWRPYSIRADAYKALGNHELAILDYAQSYRIDFERKPGKWSATDNTSDFWYQSIYRHLMDQVWPKLSGDTETFIEYWPCFMEWGKHSKVKGSRDDVYTMTYSTYGSGYLLLTTKNLYLFSLADVTRKFPLYEGGFIASFLSIGIGKTNRQVEKTDQRWSIPYTSISGAQITGDELTVITATMTWEISEHFRNHLPIMLAGINAGISGKYTSNSRPTIKSPAVQRDEVFGLLKQLNELRIQGILNEAEFESKKKELLARL